MTTATPAEPLPPTLRYLRVGETAVVGDYCADHNTGDWGPIRIVFGDLSMQRPEDCERFARLIPVGGKHVPLSRSAE